MLDAGFDPAARDDQGSGLISACFSGMDWPERNSWFDGNKRRNIDTERSREKVKMIYALAQHGARWTPKNNYEINDIRRTLLKMTDDYTVEFVWILSKFKSCTRDNVKQLLRTPAIRRHTSAHSQRIDEIITSIESI